MLSFFNNFQNNRSEWQIVFIIAAVLFFAGNVIYLLFGTAVSQPWDAEDYLLPKDAESAIEIKSKEADNGKHI